MSKKTVFILLGLVWMGCTKDRSLAPSDPGGGGAVGPGYLKINEYLAKGDAFLSDLGTPSDWIEIFNPQPFEVTLKEGLWYVTDAMGSNDLKFMLPEVKIPSKGHLLIWCDGQGAFTGMVHTNFSLSSAGEDLGLFFMNGGEKVLVDQRSYGAQTLDNVSEGRSPDGSGNWVSFNTPTPGAPNP
ncbi:MAG: lamin tail domain-containing protein [Flavobacteriales bacterium]|nr:lamin tail domain-containing protein [Flavobacteriales bacterium]MDW8433115.1 hypothetical protein [Flavobacteriales bacterium]